MSQHEIELKFGIPAERLPDLKRALGRGVVRSERLHAEYFDTEDALLARHQVSLRLRREGGRWIQTVKAATGDAARRLEDNSPIAAARSAVAPALDLARHDGTPAGAALRKALASYDSKREPALAARFRVEVQRSTRTVRHAGARIELAIDIGRFVAAGVETAISEFEMELKSGSEAALFSLAERWLGAHGLWLVAESKAARGARLARGEKQPAPVRAATPAPAPDGTGCAADFVRAVLRSCLEQIVGNASALADGSADEDHIHQLRVGLRRLRSALRELGDLFAPGAIDDAWEPALRAVFGELGEHRDRAIVLPRWAKEIAKAGAPPLTPPTPPARLRTPQTIVRDAALQSTLLGLLRCAADPAAVEEGGKAPADAAAAAAGARRPLAARLDKLHTAIARDAKRFAGLPGERQHQVRKRLKRLRYLSEFALALFPKKGVKRYLEAMSEAQDELGTLNDERIAEEAYRRDAEQHPHAWFAAGWLAARQAESVVRCELALKRVARARRFWKKAA